MSKTMDVLHKIDKQVGSNADKLEYLNKNFEDHKHGDSKRREKQAEWELRMEDAVKECPEVGHIKEQNGKLDRLTLLTKSLALIGTGILILGAAGSLYFGFWNHREKAPSTVFNSIPVDHKYVYELKEVD